MLIIQISDTHVKAPGELYKEKVDTHAHMARAVDHIRTKLRILRKTMPIKNKIQHDNSAHSNIRIFSL